MVISKDNYTAKGPNSARLLANSERELTSIECKKLYDFACAANGARTSESPHPALKSVKAKQRSVFDKLRLKNDTAKECVQHIAWRFMIEIGVQADTIHAENCVAMVDPCLIPNTTQDVATALTKVREDQEVRRSLIEDGATQSDIDAAFKIFADHINGKILSNTRQLG